MGSLVILFQGEKREERRVGRRKGMHY